MRLLLLISFALMAGCGDGGSSNSTIPTKESSESTTVENPDGGATTTEELDNGNIIVTVVYPDGSTTETIMFPDGSTSVSTTPADENGDLPVMKLGEGTFNKSRLG